MDVNMTENTKKSTLKSQKDQMRRSSKLSDAAFENKRLQKDAINKVNSKPALTSLGNTGLQHQDGKVFEEFLPQLQTFQQRISAYTEMKDNDAVIGAILFITDMLIRNVTWSVIPFSSDKDDQDAAEFIESCMVDMEYTWEEMMSEILSMLPYGFSLLEKVYKVRKGKTKDKKTNSKFDDGRYGWRKLPLRSQDSMTEWVFDDDGEVTGIKQQKYRSMETTTIPIEKLLHFRTKSFKNNPEGLSILRTAFKAYYNKKNIENIENIGIERDLTGFPVMKIPSDVINADSGAYQEYQNIIKNIRRDEMEGLIIPSDKDPISGHPLVEFSLVASPGTRQFDINATINRYDKRIAGSVAADFLLLGQDQVGSFALSSDKTTLFASAIGGWLKAIAATLNRHAVDDLLEINNMKGRCYLQHGDLENADVEKLARALQSLSATGAMIGDEQINSVLRRADIPEIQDEKT
jgi:hypothetical protein